jgi:hypothetical protein
LTTGQIKKKTTSLVKKFRRFEKKPCDGQNLKNFLTCWQTFEARKISVQDWCIHLLVGMRDPSSKLL